MIGSAPREPETIVARLRRLGSDMWSNAIAGGYSGSTESCGSVGDLAQEAADRIVALQGQIPQWLPIETAPQDGRDILVLHADGSVCISYWGCIRGVYGLKSKLHSSASGGVGDFCRDATCWQPLPPLPSDPIAPRPEEAP